VACCDNYTNDVSWPSLAALVAAKTYVAIVVKTSRPIQKSGHVTLSCDLCLWNSVISVFADVEVHVSAKLHQTECNRSSQRKKQTKNLAMMLKSNTVITTADSNYAGSKRPVFYRVASRPRS